jgi:hypothetical protein
MLSGDNSIAVIVIALLPVEVANEKSQELKN